MSRGHKNKILIDRAVSEFGASVQSVYCTEWYYRCNASRLSSYSRVSSPVVRDYYPRS